MSKMILIEEATVKLALKALEEIHPGNMTPIAEEAWKKAITAIRKALAEQPEQQEPVGKKTRIGLVTSAGWDSLPVGTEFYTTPQAQPAQRKPLSNFAKAAIYAKHFGNPVPDAWYAAINDLEAAHGITGETQ